MIVISQIRLKYGDRVILNDVSTTVSDRDRIGLVGRNGAGKSTLLKLIAKEFTADSGQINIPPRARVGFLQQDMKIPQHRSVLDETMTAFSQLQVIEEEIAEIQGQLEERTDYESDAYMKLLERMSDLTDRFQFLGGNTMQADAERVLSGLGFKSSDLPRGTSQFSGGWQMRIELAKLLLQKPDYLLLDEPTNHLDIESIMWLESFLQTYEGSILVISHDRTFLDEVTKRTIEIELGNLYDYKANYSKFKILQRERREKLEATYKNQKKEIEHKEQLIEKFRAKKNKAKFAQSLIKQLDSMELVTVESEDSSSMNMKFLPAPRSGEVVVDVKNMTKSFGEVKVLEDVDFQMIRGERVAFVGQNGQGKTTLSKIIAQAESITGGQADTGYNVEIGYYAQNQAENLDRNSTVLQTLENVSPAELRPRLRGILGAFLFSGDDVEKKVSVLSGGERARVALACLLLRPVNLLILDEPTNHLDMTSKEVLKTALNKYDGSLIVVSHDRDFLTGLTERTLEFRDHKLFNHRGDVIEFLARRKMENMRQVELSKPKSASIGSASTDKSRKNKSNGSSQSSTAPKANKRVLTGDEKKFFHKHKQTLEKQVKKAEGKIETTEKKIADFEKLMANPEFYGSEGSEKILSEYNEVKDQLETVMDAWEADQMELEEFIEEYGQ